MLSSSNTLRALNDDGSAPLGVQFLGLADGATDNYALAFENIRYAVWTFGVFGPSLYTSEGKDLFVNVIEYVQSEPVNIAYIYDTDDTDALAYQTFLESVGYLVALFDVTEVAAKADFSEFDMFIVDNNAGESSWTSAAADVLVSSAKPVIVHNDGIFVFDETTQFLREDNTLALDPAMSVIPHMTDHAVWSEPYALELPESGPVDVLSSTATYRGLHDDGTAPGDVEFLGSDTAFLNHYPLAIQGARYALWGPGAAAPTSYTVFARELYFNLIEYLQAGEPVGDDDDDTGDDDAGDDDDDDDDDLDDDVTTGDDDDDDDDDGGCCGC
ncbi:MAG: hypothetical protein M5R36_06030 [Deltaproteobacteria bacterium]|nr:hypothetical protein [Deltaproteobacteria bacterium]